MILMKLPISTLQILIALIEGLYDKVLDLSKQQM